MIIGAVTCALAVGCMFAQDRDVNVRRALALFEQLIVDAAAREDAQAASEAAEPPDQNT